MWRTCAKRRRLRQSKSFQSRRKGDVAKTRTASQRSASWRLFVPFRLRSRLASRRRSKANGRGNRNGKTTATAVGRLRMIPATLTRYGIEPSRERAKPEETADADARPDEAERARISAGAISRAECDYRWLNAQRPGPSSATAAAVHRNMICNSIAQPPCSLRRPMSPRCTR